MYYVRELEGAHQQSSNHPFASFQIRPQFNNGHGMMISDLPLSLFALQHIPVSQNLASF